MTSHPPARPPQAAADAGVREGITLVLGGGGFKGVAHVGVLRALQLGGIRVERVVGTSAGALAAAIVELPFKYRAAVVLRHVMGLDYAEVARALDLPLNTFKSHLLRGTKLLREGLAPELDAPRTAPSGSNGRHPAEAGDGERLGEAGARPSETRDLGEVADARDARPVPERIAGG